MTKDPTFPFFYSDWLGSSRIALMDAHEERGLLRILCHMWANENCALPDDDSILSRLSLMQERWFNGGLTVVRECLAPHPDKPGFVTNLKLLGLKRERQEWRRKSQAGGIRSGEARRNAKGGTKGGSTTARTKDEPKTNTPSSSSSSSTSSSTSSIPPSDSKEKNGAVPRTPVELPAGIDTPEVKQALADFLAMRAEIKKPVKPTALKQIVNRLTEFGPAKAVRSLQNSIAGQWQGLFDPDERNNGKPGRNDPRGNLALRDQLLRSMEENGHE